MGDTLELTPEQRSELLGVGDDLARELPIDPEATPLEALGVRRQWVARIVDHVPTILTAEQGAMWERVSTRVPAFLGGRAAFRRLGTALGDELPSQVLGAWQDAFGLPEADLARLRADAHDFIEASQGLLRQHRGDERALEQALFELAQSFERRVLSRLSAEQRDHARGREPLVLEIRSGRSHILGHSGQAGF